MTPPRVFYGLWIGSIVLGESPEIDFEMAEDLMLGRFSPILRIRPFPRGALGFVWVDWKESQPSAPILFCVGVARSSTDLRSTA